MVFASHFCSTCDCFPLQMRRAKIDGFYPCSFTSNAMAAVNDSLVSLAPTASGRSGSRKIHSSSLVQTLMSGGTGGTLPSGVVALGQEKRAIESLLQQVSIYHISPSMRSVLNTTSIRGIFLPQCRVLPCM